MFKKILFSVLILFMLVCSVAGEDTALVENGIETNVYFCRMIEAGDSYELEFLPTLYMGKNNLGKLIFYAGTDNLEKGDYALIQKTSDGIKLIQSLTITKYGKLTPEYAILRLELKESQLPEPLEIMGETKDSVETATEIRVIASEAATAQNQIKEENTNTGQKTPIATTTVLAGISFALICMIAGVRRR